MLSLTLAIRNAPGFKVPSEMSVGRAEDLEHLHFRYRYRSACYGTQGERKLKMLVT